MVLVDGQGIPLGSTLASASSAEVTLAEETLETGKVPRNGLGRPKKRPLRLVAGKGYDIEPLRKRFNTFKIDLIVPHRKNRKKPKIQDGRKLRRYRKRWKIERTFSWPSNFRRLVVRSDLLITIYRGFFHLACLMIGDLCITSRKTLSGYAYMFILPLMEKLPSLLFLACL